MIDPNELMLQIALLLDALRIPYHVGGSFASSAHGMYRASADFDIVIDPTVDQVEALAKRLDRDFYVSRSAIAEALADRSTFNAIHHDTSFKLDFFIKGASPFDAVEMERSVSHQFGEPNGLWIRIKSPEDTILRKLHWFRRGGSVSERQWQDVMSILRLNAGQLDDAHLDRWALELEVSDLLHRARLEAAGTSGRTR